MRANITRSLQSYNAPSVRMCQAPGWHLHEVVILVHMFLQPCIRAEGLGAVRTGHRGVCCVDMVVQLVGIGEHLVTELAERAWVTLEAMGRERRVVEEERIASPAIERWRQWERGRGRRCGG